MNSITDCQVKASGRDGGRSWATWLRAHSAKFFELFWFCLSFLLFLVLGPFSVIVVLIGLGSLASEENREQMREPARL